MSPGDSRVLLSLTTPILKHCCPSSSTIQWNLPNLVSLGLAQPGLIRYVVAV